jgi:hypothetical protein
MKRAQLYPVTRAMHRLQLAKQEADITCIKYGYWVMTALIALRTDGMRVLL